MHLFWKKSFLFLFGTFVALFAFEGILFFVGAFYGQHSQKTQEINRAFKGEKTFTIMCVGNSHTHGAGAQKGEGYPEQLQKMFKDRYPNVSVSVVNKGISNATSTNILTHIRSWVEEVRPDVVTLRIGEPNEWNYSDFHTYLKRKQLRQEKWTDFFWRLRSVRFFQRMVYHRAGQRERSQAENYQAILWLELIQNSSLSDVYSRLTQTSRGEMERALKTYYEKYPDEHYVGFVLSQLYLEQREHAKALDQVEKIVASVDDFHFMAYRSLRYIKDGIGHSPKQAARILKIEKKLDVLKPSAQELSRIDNFFAQYKTADVKDIRTSVGEDVYAYALKMLPGDAWILLPYYEQILLPEKRYGEALELLTTFHQYNTSLNTCGDCYVKLYKAIKAHAPEKLEQIERSVTNFNEVYKKRFGVESFLQTSPRTDHLTWATEDIKEIVEVLKNLKVNYVVLNYPVPPVGSRALDDHIRSLALAEGYNFIDSTKNLEDQFKRMSTEERLSHYALSGNLDAHLNKKGYELLAKELFVYLEENYFREMGSAQRAPQTSHN